MSIILIVFANDVMRPLEMLSSECNAIQLLLNRVFNKSYQVIMLPKVTPKLLIEILKTHGSNIEIFHYSGHANGMELATEELTIKSLNLASIFKDRCPNLKLAFLNGCETMEQVDDFHKAGVAHVIATNVSIRDDESAWLAEQFYQYLSLGRSVQSAMEAVSKDSRLFEKDIYVRVRGVRPVKEDYEFKCSWNLYSLDVKQQYKLPLKSFKIESAAVIDHKDFLRKMILSLEGFDSPESDTYLDTIEEIKGGSFPPDKTILVDLLNVLPYPLGIRLRQINASIDTENNSEDYYRQLLYDYVCFIETTLQYTFANLTSQIWGHIDHLFGQGNSKKLLEDIQSHIKVNKLTQPFSHYISAITAAHQLIEISGIPHPFKKLRAVIDDLNFADAFTFFDVLKGYYWQNIRLTNEESITHCYQAQDFLMEIFPKFAFLIEQVLVSIRHINVINFRHIKESYKSEVWRLFASEQGRIRPIVHQKPMENKSVLVYSEKRVNADKASINLFPFFIDRSAFSPQTGNVLNLYQLVGYFADDWSNKNSKDSKEHPCFYYMSLNDPGKIWRFDDKNPLEGTLYHIDEEREASNRSKHMLANPGELSSYFEQFQKFLSLENHG